MIQILTKTAVVVVSSTILSTLTLNAFDMREYVPASLLALMFQSSHESTGPCPVNMVLVTQALVPFCVDMYEASADTVTCPFGVPVASGETALNLADVECKAVSSAGAMPWRYVSQLDAQQACSRAGKRLLKPDEWYKAALGTPDPASEFGEDDCNVARNRSDGVSTSGGGMRCVSDAGVYDMIGNVWEWVDGTVSGGVYESSTLPQGGYVHEVDLHGMAHTTGTAQNELFGHDRFWLDASIYAGIMRGGYFDNADHAGLYSTYAASPPTFSGDAVGFRCAVTPIGL